MNAPKKMKPTTQQFKKMNTRFMSGPAVPRIVSINSENAETNGDTMSQFSLTNEKSKKILNKIKTKRMSIQ